MNFVSSMGYKVFNDSLDKIIFQSKPLIINTISPNSYGIAFKDSKFRNALKSSDFLVLDGVYFALSSIILNKKNIKKNQGPDVFLHFMNRFEKIGGKIFFLGSTNDTLDKISIKCRKIYPNLQIETFSPSYSDDENFVENDYILQKINQFQPDVLFVGLTCPKQEKWVFVNGKYINTKYICSIGAVFDWFAGNQKEIHKLWWKLRLGWLKRTIDRPEILKRYPNIFIYFRDLLLYIIRFKKINSNE